MNTMDALDIAWLTGLWEGEGSFVLPTAQPNTVGLSIFMTDEDIIRRVGEITGCGSVRGPYTNAKRPNAKPIWKWCTVKHSDVARLMLAMYPLLGNWRRAKIAEAIPRMLGYKRNHRGYCAKGHRYTRVNPQGVRYCLECSNEAQRRRRAAEKAVRADSSSKD